MPNTTGSKVEEPRLKLITIFFKKWANLGLFLFIFVFSTLHIFLIN